MQKLNFGKRLSRSITKLICWGVSIGAIAIVPQSTLAAENLRFNYGLLSFSLPIDALEQYAKEGQINRKLDFYTKRLDERTVIQLGRVLRRRINIDPILLYRLMRSPMGEEIIQNLGEVATNHIGHNGFYAIRGSVTNAAIENRDRGVSLIDVLRRFPGKNISIDVGKLVELRKELTALVEYREAIRDLVVRQSEQEGIGIGNSFLPQKDLRTSGGIAVTQRTLTIDSRIADLNSGVRSRQPFRVRLYLPQGLSEATPVVILSHGFGSEPKSFNYLGEHLASYGIAAVSVEHLGSDSDYELEILGGKGSDKRAIAASEFVERPLDIHHVLDELERLNQTDPDLQGTLDLDKVGRLGIL
ncbi:MAG: alpha/beta hydrolase [Cyanobacteria bacterium P01_E01_bin.35]